MTRYGSNKGKEYIDVDVVAGGSSSAPYSATTTVSGGSSSAGIKPDKKRGGGIGHALFGLSRAGAKGVMWFLTPSKSGGAQYIAYAMCLACFGLSVENIYAGMKKDSPTSVRFIPKLGLVEDGADLVRILPLPGVLDAVQNTALGVVNGAIKFADPAAEPLRDNYRPKPDLVVWKDSKFWAAFVAAAMISALQAVALRQVSLEVRKRQLEAAAKKDKAIAQSLEMAQSTYEQRKLRRLETTVRRAQVKNHGNGAILIFAAVVASSYILEAWLFIVGVKPGTKGVPLVVMSLASMFGVEGFYALGEKFSNTDDYE